MKLSPGWALLSSVFVCIALCLLAVAGALRQPWLGVTLTPDAQKDTVTIARVARGGPADGLLAPGARLLSVGGLPLRASDLIEEPDFFDSYSDMASFFDRQGPLHRALLGPTVTVSVRDGGDATRTLSPRPRPLGSLPAVFWFQLFAGCAGLLIGCWVLVLRRDDLGARMFAMTGFMFPVFTTPAAVYSTREIAVDGHLFRALSSLNHGGANLFGCALVSLFLCHPRPLVRPRYLWLIFAFVMLWWMVDVLRLAPSQDWGSRLPILLEMLGAIGAALLQWRRARRDPATRAALRWFGLSMVVGCGLFVFTTVSVQLLGWFPPLPQGYAFGFFLIMYAGLALGVRRYNLFELDLWAFRVLVWVLGALLLLGLDAALALLLKVDTAASIGLALLLCGFLYLPLRGFLWAKIVLRHKMRDEELFQAVLQLAFAASNKERQRLWRALLGRLFDPLEVEDVEAGPTAVSPSEEGLRLTVPAAASSKALRLGFPWRGKGLFAPRQVRLAEQLVALVRFADSSRQAYDQGASEERRRIARDLHDDVGSRLLSGLHQESLEQARRCIREAMSETRAIVSGLAGEQLSLPVALAELRFETAQRLEAAGIALDWPAPEVSDGEDERALPYRHYKSYVSMVREAVSNIIRHARASSASVRVHLAGDRLEMRICDNGVGFDAQPPSGGRGLGNLRERAAELGGAVDLSDADGRTVLTIDLPLPSTEPRTPPPG